MFNFFFSSFIHFMKKHPIRKRKRGKHIIFFFFIVYNPIIITNILNKKKWTLIRGNPGIFIDKILEREDMSNYSFYQISP